jgi:hypothetical protein
MGFAYSPSEGTFRQWYGYQVDMVGHKTVCPYLHSTFSATFSHEGNVFLVVLIAKKGLLATIAALGNVMGNTCRYYSCYSSHVRRIAKRYTLSIKYTVPGIRPH